MKFALEHSLTDVLRHERMGQLTAGRTTDFTEGVAAFTGKRTAVFRGR
jgi:enoyl-CoA hydratase/carnithine racemase